MLFFVILLSASLLGCRSARDLPKQVVSEASVLPEITPYLGGGTASIAVSLRPTDFVKTSETRENRFSVVLFPSTSITEDFFTQTKSGNLQRFDKDISALRSKYPDIFRLQNCGPGNNCSFRRLAPEAWHIFALLSSTAPPDAFLSVSVDCWIFVREVQLDPDQDVRIVLKPGDEAAFRAEDGCIDKT